MTRPSWIGAPLAASALVHAALGLRLYTTPLEPPETLEPDTFVVRTVELAPPAPPAAPEPSAGVTAPEQATPEPPPKPTPKPAAPKAPLARPESSEPPPEPATAPEALLAAGPPGDSAGIVQVPGAPVGVLSMSNLAPPKAAPVLARPSGSFTKLSDLSRKPRAPALDAALRDNYPPEQRRRGVEGQAEVQVMIEGDGHVGEIQVLTESSAGFAEACRRTLRASQWSEPLGRDGHPVRTRLTYRCRFRIER